MSNALKILLLAASVIVTCIVITVSFNTANQAKDIAEKSNERNKQFYESLDKEDFTAIDGTEQYGSEVTNLIRKYADTDITFVVYNSVSNTFFCINREVTWNSSKKIYNIDSRTAIPEATQEIRIKGTRDKNIESGKYYINPAKVFKCQIVYNEYKEVDGVVYISA